MSCHRTKIKLFGGKFYDKKLLSIFVAIVMVMSIASVCVFAEENILDYITYKVNNGEVTITDCDESISGDVDIPDTIDGYPVTSLYEAFCFCKNITSITLPDSVRFISESSFWDCENLKTINFGNGLIHIEQFAFPGCVSLESIKIPDSVEIIGIGAFVKCSNLERVEIGKNLKTFGDSVFSGCESLKAITVDEENPYFSAENGVLYNKDKTELLYYPAGKTESTYVVSDGVETIGWSAFNSCDFLKSVEFPASVTRVNTLFEGTQLEKVTFFNKNCVITFEENSIPETAVIYGYKGSVAETYANTFNRKFVSLDDNTDANDDDVFSAFVRFFDSFVHLIKTLFNQILNLFSFK